MSDLVLPDDTAASTVAPASTAVTASTAVALDVLDVAGGADGGCGQP